MQTTHRSLAARLFLLATLSAPFSAQESRSVEIDHLDERLQQLAEEYESERVNLNVPGIAVAVVKDDKIIFAQGFGLADLESGRKVTPETTFAIGSTTKAFTAALIAMQVDAAQMDWDAPITEYLPYFELPLDTKKEDAQATVRDLLCHRTGFTRMGMLWAAGLTTREETLRVAINAEPWSGFRKKFFYNNVMWLAGGVAVGKVTGLSWDALLKKSLFDPLDMPHTNSTYALAMADENMAFGYTWQKGIGSFKREQMRNVNTIGPAGSINSNVLEMSNWIRLQLGRGTFEGKELISEAALTDTWEPNISVAGPVQYGMGWMITDYHGQQALHHGGNIDGFAAAVALLPESNIGYVMLTNTSHTPLQAPTSTLVWDALLADYKPTVDKANVDISEFDDFVGVFMANFGPFKDAEFTVSAKDAVLYMDIPGQLNFEMLPPNDEGKRALKMSPTTQFDFERDEDGLVHMVKLSEGPNTFELLRKGYEPKLDLPLAELEPFFGLYEDPNFKSPLEVKIKNGHLAVDLPGQMVAEMHLPNDEGIWMFRAAPGVGIEFEFGDDDQVVATIIHQNGKTSRGPRVEGKAKPAKKELPSLAEINELRHADAQIAALAKNGNLRFKATIRFVHSGIGGELDAVETPDGRFLVKTTMGQFGYSNVGFDGTTGWVDSAFDTYEEPKGILLDQLALSPVSTYFGDWSKTFDEIRVLRAGRTNKRNCWVIQLTKGQLPAQTIHLDKETGDILRIDAKVMTASGIEFPNRTDFDDYRTLNGLRLPYLTTTKNDQAGATVFKYEDMQHNVELADGIFEPRE